MKMSDQECRNEAFRLVSNLIKRAKDFGLEEDRGGVTWRVFDPESIETSRTQMVCAEADLLTFMDDLIHERPGFGEATQKAINKCNERIQREQKRGGN